MAGRSKTKTALRPVPQAPAEIPTMRRPEPALGSDDDVEVMLHDEVPQGSDEWFRLHVGVPTASVFRIIMADGKDGDGSRQRAKLLREMAGEVLTGEPRETFANASMERGKAMEAEARAGFFSPDGDLELVGFVRRKLPRGRVVGCSPDAFIGAEGVLEIKTMAPHLMIEMLESGRIPVEHRAQCQGSLWVTGRKFAQLRVFYRGMPFAPSWRFDRDEPYIRVIAEQVEIFQHEVESLVKRIKAMGGKK